jgi:hypothetical protein
MVINEPSFKQQYLEISRWASACLHSPAAKNADTAAFFTQLQIPSE